MEKIGERLAYLIDSTGLNKSQFAKKYGFTDSAVRAMCLGDKPVGLKIATKLVEVFPTLNLNWLFYGTGGVNYINKDTEHSLHLLKEPEEFYGVDRFEEMILYYLGRPSVVKKVKEIASNENNNENFTLKIELGEENSELLQRVEQMVKNDLKAHKLPTKNKSIDKQGDDV